MKRYYASDDGVACNKCSDPLQQGNTEVMVYIYDLCTEDPCLTYSDACTELNLYVTNKDLNNF